MHRIIETEAASPQVCYYHRPMLAYGVNWHEDHVHISIFGVSRTKFSHTLYCKDRHVVKAGGIHPSPLLRV